MLQTQNAKFAITLIKSRWYKKGVGVQNITIYYSLGIYYDQGTNTTNENSALNSMYGIQNLRQEIV